MSAFALFFNKIDIIKLFNLIWTILFSYHLIRLLSSNPTYLTLLFLILSFVSKKFDSLLANIFLFLVKLIVFVDAIDNISVALVLCRPFWRQSRRRVKSRNVLYL